MQSVAACSQVLLQSEVVLADASACLEEHSDLRWLFEIMAGHLHNVEAMRAQDSTQVGHS